MPRKKSLEMGSARGEAPSKVDAAIAGTLTGALSLVVARLTNEMLLFVIALMILTALVTIVAPSYSATMLPLVAFFGVLGFCAYIWNWRRPNGRRDIAIREATRRVTKVAVVKASGNFLAAGEMRRASAGTTGDIEVTVREGTGNASVIGVLSGADRDQTSDEETALLNAFRKLDAAAQKQARRSIEDWNDKLDNRK
jgi:uncharacterized membrane protein